VSPNSHYRPILGAAVVCVLMFRAWRWPSVSRWLTRLTVIAMSCRLTARSLALPPTANAGLIAFVHTEVDERFQGRGLGDRLIRGALEDARARGLAVLPFCPFMKAFIERHREFEALVPDAYREQFGL